MPRQERLGSEHWKTFGVVHTAYKIGYLHSLSLILTQFLFYLFPSALSSYIQSFSALKHYNILWLYVL